MKGKQLEQELFLKQGDASEMGAKRLLSAMVNSIEEKLADTREAGGDLTVDDLLALLRRETAGARTLSRANSSVDMQPTDRQSRRASNMDRADDAKTSLENDEALWRHLTPQRSRLSLPPLG